VSKVKVNLLLCWYKKGVMNPNGAICYHSVRCYPHHLVQMAISYTFRRPDALGIRLRGSQKRYKSLFTLGTKIELRSHGQYHPIYRLKSVCSSLSLYTHACNRTHRGLCARVCVCVCVYVCVGTRPFFILWEEIFNL